jgi:SAM-dependent methyltransferase
MKEAEIRPQHLLQRYLDLSAEDASRCFSGVKRDAIPCVACGAVSAKAEFSKHGFGYASCGACGTLYQSPRPEIAAFERFYRDSVSSRFWAEEFFPAVAEARRESIFQPRVERLAALCSAKGITVERLVDVGAGFGIFLDEWRKRFPETELLAVEPGAKLAQICRDQGFAVVEDIVENMVGHDELADLVVCFEVLEHVYDPVSFIRILSRLVKPGGHVFISTLGVDGYDIQTLWENSNSIFPKGFEQAFVRAGLMNIDISTPGKLDVDIVRNAFSRDPALLEGNHFAQLLIQDAARGAAFQQFIADNRLSSHTWVLAQKPVR